MPSTALARFLRRELETDPPRASSLIVTVWGDAIAPSHDEVWLSTLFALLAPFGVNERAVRTGIFRLAASSWFEAKSVGRRSRYRLTVSGAEGFEQAFHRVYDAPFMRWDGRWEGAIVALESIAAAMRKRLRQELAWAGFGRFGPGVYLRPARGDASIERIAASLHVEDAITTFEARDRAQKPISGLRSRTMDVWALAALATDYRQFIARFGSVGSAFGKLDADPEQVFVLRTLLMHAYRRVRLRDPQLPRGVLPRDWPAAQAYELARRLHRLTRIGATAFVNGVFAGAEPPPRKSARSTRRFVDSV